MSLVCARAGRRAAPARTADFEIFIIFELRGIESIHEVTAQ